MTNASTLQWTFVTKKGVERTDNKDYFSILDSEVGTWIIAFDIATSSQATTELAKCYIESISQALQYSNVDDVGVRKEVIQDAFEATKRKIRVGKASFLSVYYSATSEKIVGLSAGDCRAGILKENSIEWLSPVHTGANPLGELFIPEMRFKDERHILTRSFNLRRDFEPEEFELALSSNEVLVLATDGFWLALDDIEQRSFIARKVANFADDASVLAITWKDKETQGDFENNADENLLVVRNFSTD